MAANDEALCAASHRDIQVLRAKRSRVEHNRDIGFESLQQQGAADRSHWDGAQPQAKLLTGMRLAEALALRWQDVQQRVLSIRRSLSWTSEGPLFSQPTTAAGRRSMP